MASGSEESRIGSPRFLSSAAVIAATPHRPRRRFSRTFSRARWDEYRRFLQSAIGRGYAIRSFEDFLREPGGTDQPQLLLRHDVDQRPASALDMAAIEAWFGLTSTWYFRWRTADPEVVSTVRARGGTVGFHYETLTRRVLATGEDPAAIQKGCRNELRREVEAFSDLFGPIDSISAHGDTRVPGVENTALTRGQEISTFGVSFDANESIRAHRLGLWLTDRSAAEGRWGSGRDPQDAFSAGVTPILCLTHPNNWISGSALWRDRLLAAALPDPAPGKPVRIARRRPDEPPATQSGRRNTAQT